MSLPASTPTAPERRPGDFQRDDKGTPYVSDPVKVRKDGQPWRVRYGRPSNLGKQIENTYNLDKWNERQVALGIALGGVDASVLLPVDQDDPAWKSHADGVVVEAKRAAGAHLAAERGTHTHLTTELDDEGANWLTRAEAGEELGIPADIQASLVQAWRDMLAELGLEIVANEATVVNDAWRQAGTLDRIARLTRDLRFATATGELVTLSAGTHIVLDIKTGKLTADKDGYPRYWHSYAIQIAAYADAVPYDTDTDTRGQWPFAIDKRWAVIAHLDVLAALDGAPTCRPILVDIEAGRAAGEVVMAAKAWQARADLFGHLHDVGAPVDADTERQALRERRERMRVNAVQTGRVEQFDAEWARHGITATSTNAEIAAALDAIEPPFDPDPAPPHGIERPAIAETPAPDDGGPCDQQALADLIASITRSDRRAVINAWLVEGHRAGVSWDPRTQPHVRQWEITRAACLVADATDGDTQCSRLLVATVLGHDPQTTVGATLGTLTIDEAKRLSALARAFGDPLGLRFADDGTPYLVGDVDRILATAA